MEIRSWSGSGGVGFLLLTVLIVIFTLGVEIWELNLVFEG